MTTRWHTIISRLRALGPVTYANIALFIFAASVFASVADEVREEEYLPVEIEIMHAFRTGDPPRPIGPDWLASTARDITALGSTVVLVSLVGLVAGFLALARHRAAAIFVVAASLGGSGLNSLLKSVFGRHRPEEALRLVEIESLSFPSGHAMSSATIYLTLAVLLLRLVERRRQKVYIILAALGLSFFVGLSRVYLGVHYPTDVIAGWAAGVAWAQICAFAAQLIGRRQLARTDL